MDNQEQINEPYKGPFLLEDCPTTADQLESHRRIAAGLAHLIRNDKGGKGIWLSGPWGSGKSTVVELLKELLNDDKEKQVFVFDSWAHQGDPLRLSFLEELYDFIKIKWGTLAPIEEEVARLRSPRTIVVTKTLSQLNYIGIAFAISLPFALIGNSLLSSYGFRQWPLGILFLVFALAPLLIVLFAKYCDRGEKNASPTNDSKPTQPGESYSFELLLQKPPETRFEEINRDPNPTSVHFRRLFVSIIKQVLNKEKRRLALVLDNLDRTDPVEALQILATMRTFIDPSQVKAEPELSRLWLIMPLDLPSLTSFWSRSHKSEDKPEASSKSAVAALDQSGGEWLTAFMKKNFQVRIDVPTPTLYYWKSFFLNKLKLAFSDSMELNEADQNTLYFLYDRRPNPERVPTAPREIISFINRLVILHHQHPGIPLIVVGAYELHFRKQPDLAKLLLGRQKIAPASISDLLKSVTEELLRDYLAALHFNLDVRSAMHAILTPAIVDAFNTGNEEFIAKHSHLQGFDDVCEQVARDQFSGMASDQLALTAVALKSLRENKTPQIQRLWGLLYDVIETKQGLLFTSELVAEGIEFLITTYPGPDDPNRFILGILEQMTSSFSFTAGQRSVPSDEMLSRWVKGTLTVLQFLQEWKYKKLIEEAFAVNPADYHKVLLFLCQFQSGDEVSQFYKLDKSGGAGPTPVQKVCENLAESMSSGQYLECFTDPFSLMRKEYWDWPWTSSLDRAQQLLRQKPAGAIVLGCLQLFLSLTEIAKHQKARQILEKLWADSAISLGLQTVEKTNNTKAIAYWLYLHLFIRRDNRTDSYFMPKLKRMRSTPEQNVGLLSDLAFLVIRYQKVVDLGTLIQGNHVLADFLKEIMDKVSEISGVTEGKTVIRASCRAIGETEE